MLFASVDVKEVLSRGPPENYAVNGHDFLLGIPIRSLTSWFYLI